MREFYIIGHNPNTVDDALDYLDNGANAIEPDVCYHSDDDDFYVYDKDEFWENWAPKKLKLTDYLNGLADALENKPRNLALIAFDLKGPYYVNDDVNQPVYDINRLYAVIRDNFSKTFPNVAILTTVADFAGRYFIAKVKGNQRLNEAVGIDENATSDVMVSFFKDSGLSYTYANGTSSPFTTVATEKFENDIKDAVALRNANTGLKLVYVWTVTAEHTMEVYLDMGVDGILTGKKNVHELVKLLNSKYAGQFQLAKMGDNPFARDAV